ncbi:MULTISPECIES: hypothetical protein [unclassified Nostoc]|uniref:hypothetical protein n=1 Tax=unclassified Nostoc TaxID=2593658 RepID=UPI002AD30B2C|nr:hypothetical protein [Nostoc sp. DedQUE03]MDZ7973914.1 hypothetical protein [Nostoc sp. DedQUE03]MDZ8047455.1 hypothetical protein [Nostoc sp. DedQUE02]
MGIFQNVSETFSREAKKYTTIFLPKHRVDKDYDDTPIRAGEAYCRIWLEDMNLAKDVDWFKQRYPVVNAAVRFHYDSKLVTIPFLAAPGQLKDLGSNNLDKVILERCPLTPLFPFNQGLVEFEAGLFSMAASDSIGKFIETMGRFAKLLPTPQLSTVLNLAEPVYRGIEDLLDIGERRLELGYRQTFSDADGGSSNFLREGYFAVILAEEREIQMENLCVVKDNLRLGSPGNTKVFLRDSKPFKGFSYMLFRIEKRKQQDWESLETIKELVTQAQNAIYSGEYDKVKKFILPAIEIAILQSPDVAKADRRNMILKIGEELKEVGLQSTKVQKRSLYSIMQRPLPEIDAATEAELASLEQLFQQNGQEISL